MLFLFLSNSGDRRRPSRQLRRRRFIDRSIMSNNNHGDFVESMSVLRQKHGAHILELVEENLKAEDVRQQRLGKLKDPLSRQRMEKSFVMERQKERERIERLQTEQKAVIRSKVQQFTSSNNQRFHTQGDPAFGTSAQRMAPSNAQSHRKKASKLKTHGSTMVVGSKGTMFGGSTPSSRQSRRSLAETVQDTVSDCCPFFTFLLLT